VQGFVAADRLRDLISSLGDQFGELPAEEELRKQVALFIDTAA
jgi:hypothetical protein